MKFYQENIYHVYNRGNNHQKIFFEKKNYSFFLTKMKNHLLPHCNILAWCLMPNHFHWMIHVQKDYMSEDGTKVKSSDKRGPVVEPLNMSISTLLSSYTRAVNNMNNRSGSLFQRRTKSKNLSPDLKTDDNYPMICFLYIHQNPLKAGLVKKLDDWKFSSFRDYAGVRNGQLCNKKLALELLDLPDNHEKFVRVSNQTIPEHVVNKIF